MRWDISAWAIRNPLPPLLLFVVLCTLGVISFRSLPQMRYPSTDVTKVSVTVGLSGTAPAELETQVTRKVENALAALAGVRHISSTVVDGQSTTTLEFRLDVRAAQALSDVTDAVAKVRNDLPSTIDEPVIQNITVQGDAIRTYVVENASLTTEQLSWLIDDRIAGDLQSLEGVGRVSRVGGVTREVQVNLDPDKLMALGVTAADINAQLRLINLDLTGGKSRIGDGEQVIRSLASASSIMALGTTRVALAGGRTARLSDLGTIVDHWAEPVTFARLDGVPIIGLAVFRSTGASDVSVGQRVDHQIGALMKRDPALRVRQIDDTVAYTTGNVEAALRTLYEGAALAIVVVMLFLRNWRATLIAGLALPLSAVPTFLAMSLLGFSLNIVTLLGITLVTGILVDDAIVEIENIVRHLHMGKTPYRAALDAADEIGLTVAAISATVIFIFGPVSFMPDVAGQYFKQFGITIAFAVFFSLLVARLITPPAAAFLMRAPGQLGRHAGETRDGVIMRLYLGLLTATLSRGMRWVTLGLAIASFAAAVLGMSALPTEFVPEPDDSRLMASIELPPGATLDAASATADRISEALKSVPEIVGIFVKGGTSQSGPAEPRRAEFVLRLMSKTDRRRSQKDLQMAVSQVLTTIPDIRFTFDHQQTMALVGPDRDGVATGAAVIEAAMGHDPLFVDPMALTSFSRPEVRLVPKRDQPSLFGVAPSVIADTIRIATTGASASNLAKFTDGGREIPIRVQIDPEARRDLDRLALLQVPIAGGSVPLSALVDIGYGEGPASIERYDRQNFVKIGFDPATGHTSGDGAKRVTALVAAASLPAGVHLQDAGDSELEAQMFADFAVAMGVGIMLVFVVLILLFGSVFLPVTILASLPLSLGGVVVALLVTRSAFSLPVVIGLLMLMGIVTKNSIMLVDVAATGAKAGLSRVDAVVEGARKRARPILMTTLAMAAGMMPSVYAVGVGGEFRAPVAVAVIGGLLASTVLSLVVVPAFYTIMDDLSRRTIRAFTWTFRPNQPDADCLHGDQSPTRGPVAKLLEPSI